MIQENERFNFGVVRVRLGTARVGLGAAPLLATL
jgi:hypothetical protein